MSIKLLIKSLKKRFNKLSPNDKETIREMANNETISDIAENKQKVKVQKRRTKKMADEKEVEKEEVDTEKVETENKEVDKEKSTDVAKDGEKVEETVKKEETTEKEPEDAAEETPTAPQVNETEESGNGIRVEDLVTKDMLADRLAALEAKFDAVVKENSDLKQQLTDKSDELKGMQEKYENKDFGNFQKQGIVEKDKHANSSFDEYSKQFM